MTFSSQIRRIAPIAGVACLMLAGPAAAQPIYDRPDDARTLQLTLRYEADTLTNVDLGAPGPSVGDRLVFAADAYRGNRRVGVGAGECINVRHRPGDSQLDHCVGVLSLPQGQITVQWLVDRIRDPRPTKVALTGGTGAYHAVHGEMLVSAPDAQGIEALLLQLVR